ncbi:hypothetical protein LCGC14_2587360 [marine sediment metagenome]|uniref:Uncharacterized protein n=1 Tax=marine sediment metagenome TaxID=412755 RepID=A0A0F9D5F6_9ZZZZ
MSAEGVIRQCPRGEEWPLTSFTSYVNTKVKFQTHDTITFSCPAGHTFTLMKAVEKKVFTPDEALKMIAYADQHMPEKLRDVKQALREFHKKPRRKER